MTGRRAIWKRPGAGEAGQSMAEFAVTLLVLVLIIFGIVDLGRAIWIQNMLSNAAREGARCASVPGCGDPIAAAKAQIVGIPLDAVTPQVIPLTPTPGGDPNAPGSVEVKVKYVFHPASGLIGQFADASSGAPQIVLTGRAVMRKEIKEP